MFAMAWGAASLYSDEPLGALICLAAKRPTVTAPLMWPPDRPPIAVRASLYHYDFTRVSSAWARRIPGAELVVYEAHGHTSIAGVTTYELVTPLGSLQASCGAGPPLQPPLSSHAVQTPALPPAAASDLPPAAAPPRRDAAPVERLRLASPKRRGQRRVPGAPGGRGMPGMGIPRGIALGAGGGGGAGGGSCGPRRRRGQGREGGAAPEHHHHRRHRRPRLLKCVER